MHGNDEVELVRLPSARRPRINFRCGLAFELVEAQVQDSNLPGSQPAGRRPSECVRLAGSRDGRKVGIQHFRCALAPLSSFHWRVFDLLWTASELLLTWSRPVKTRSHRDCIASRKHKRWRTMHWFTFRTSSDPERRRGAPLTSGGRINCPLSSYGGCCIAARVMTRSLIGAAPGSKRSEHVVLPPPRYSTNEWTNPFHHRHSSFDRTHARTHPTTIANDHGSLQLEWRYWRQLQSCNLIRSHSMCSFNWLPVNARGPNSATGRTQVTGGSSAEAETMSSTR